MLNVKAVESRFNVIGRNSEVLELYKHGVVQLPLNMLPDRTLKVKPAGWLVRPCTSASFKLVALVDKSSPEAAVVGVVVTANTKGTEPVSEIVAEVAAQATLLTSSPRPTRMERTRGLEPLTDCLEGSDSTTELRPRLIICTPEMADD